jgi:hypothetical protein
MIYQKSLPPDEFFDDMVSSPRPRYLIQSQKEYDELNERRKIFFTELTEQRRFRPAQLAFNVPVPGLAHDSAADLVIYEDEDRRRVLSVVDFVFELSKFPVGKIAETVDKAHRFGARFVIIIARHARWYIDVELWNRDVPAQGLVSSFPC